MAKRVCPILPADLRIPFHAVCRWFNQKKEAYLADKISFAQFRNETDFSRAEVVETVKKEEGIKDEPLPPSEGAVAMMDRFTQYLTHRDDERFNTIVLDSLTGYNEFDSKTLTAFKEPSSGKHIFSVLKARNTPYLDMEASFDAELSGHDITALGFKIEEAEPIVVVNDYGAKLLDYSAVRAGGEPIQLKTPAKCEHCDNGVVRLFTSVKPCDRCGGSGLA